jgi:hypothetical protein
MERMAGFVKRSINAASFRVQSDHTRRIRYAMYSNGPGVSNRYTLNCEQKKIVGIILFLLAFDLLNHGI